MDETNIEADQHLPNRAWHASATDQGRWITEDAWRKVVVLVAPTNSIWKGVSTEYSLKEQDAHKILRRLLGVDEKKYSDLFVPSHLKDDEKTLALVVKRIAPYLLCSLDRYRAKDAESRGAKESALRSLKETFESLTTESLVNQLVVAFGSSGQKKTVAENTNTPDADDENDLAVLEKLFYFAPTDEFVEAAKGLHGLEKIEELLIASSFEDVCRYVGMYWPDSVWHIEKERMQRKLHNRSIRSVLHQPRRDHRANDIYSPNATLFDAFHFLPVLRKDSDTPVLYLLRSIIMVYPEVVVPEMNGRLTQICMLRLPKIRKRLGDAGEGDFSPTFEYRGRVMDDQAENFILVMEKKSSRDYPDLVFINATVSGTDPSKIWGFYSSFGQNVDPRDRGVSKLQFSSSILIRRLKTAEQRMWERSDRKEVVGTQRQGPGVLLGADDVEKYNANCADLETAPLKAMPLGSEDLQQLSAVNAIGPDGEVLDLRPALKQFIQ